MSVKECDEFTAQVRAASVAFEVAAEHARKVVEAAYAAALVGQRLGLPTEPLAKLAEDYEMIAKVLETTSKNSRRFF